MVNLAPGIFNALLGNVILLTDAGMYGMKAANVMLFPTVLPRLAAFQTDVLLLHRDDAE